MTIRRTIACHDRAAGRVVQEPIFADRFLFWACNTRLGGLASELLLFGSFASRLYGWRHRLPSSRRKIRSFLRAMGAGEEEAARAAAAYGSFNDFFTRRIDPSERPLHPGGDACLAPVDGRVLAYPRVGIGDVFRVKSSWFSLSGFLRDDALAERFSGGSVVISRLTLVDYHHFHFPDGGVPAPAWLVPGKHRPGGPYALRRLMPFYTENRRMLTLFEADRFGEMVIAEVGALTVGSIRQDYVPGRRVERGERKGFFELGGSTVVLVFRPGAVVIDRDILENTAKDLETIVRMGDSIGRIPPISPRKGTTP